MLSGASCGTQQAVLARNQVQQLHDEVDSAGAVVACVHAYSTSRKGLQEVCL